MEESPKRKKISGRSSSVDPPARILSVRKAYLDALLAGNRKVALQVVRAVTRFLPPELGGCTVAKDLREVLRQTRSIA